MGLRVENVQVDGKRIEVSVSWPRKSVLEDFVMISTHAAWYLATKRLTALEYAVLFGAIGSAQFGGKVQIDKAEFARMLGANRASVSRAVSVLVEKQVLLDKGERFGNMRYYRLNRYLVQKGKPN